LASYGAFYLTIVYFLAAGLYVAEDFNPSVVDPNFLDYSSSIENIFAIITLTEVT